MPLQNQTSTLPNDWAEILNRVQEAIDRALKDLERREEKDAKMPGPAISGSAGLIFPVGACSTPLNSHSNKSSTALKRIEQSTAGADSELQDTEDALRKWIQAGEAIRRSLGQGAATGVR